MARSSRGAGPGEPPTSQSQIPVQPQLEGKPVPVMVEAGARYEGLVAFRGEVRIDGQLDGDVVAEGKLWVGAEALVTGRVEADELVIAGGIEGEVVARERIQLEATARVEAGLQAPLISAAEGSFVRGLCRSGEEGRKSATDEPEASGNA